MWKRSATTRRLEAMCERLNDGLMAVAIVLALVTTFTACQQSLPLLTALLQPIDPDTGASIASE